MNWMCRKLFLYNVTFGLYVMDWWERYLFNSIVLTLLSFIFYGATRSMWLAFDNHLMNGILLPGSGNYSMVAKS